MDGGFVTRRQSRFCGSGDHQMVVYRDNLWVFGGIDNGDTYLNDLWRSRDGKDWTRVTPLAGDRFPAIGNHQVAAHQGTLFMLGGLLTGGSSQTNVWFSTDGNRWAKLDGASAPVAGGTADRHLVSHAGSLYIISYAQVWSSADGSRWEKLTPGGSNDYAEYVGGSWSFKRRLGYSAFSFAGSLWVVGGYAEGADQNNAGQRVYWNDVYRSADGVNWTRVNGGTRFQVRAFHQITPLYTPTGWFSRRADEDGIPLD